MVVTVEGGPDGLQVYVPEIYERLTCLDYHKDITQKCQAESQPWRRIESSQSPLLN